MEKEGINQGTYLAISLRHDAHLYVGDTVAKFWRDEDVNYPNRRVYTGIVADMQDNFITLIPIWDMATNKNPHLGHIRGVQVYYDAIDTYAVQPGINSR